MQFIKLNTKSQRINVIDFFSHFRNNLVYADQKMSSFSSLIHNTALAYSTFALNLSTQNLIFVPKRFLSIPTWTKFEFDSGIGVEKWDLFPTR